MKKIRRTIGIISTIFIVLLLQVLYPTQSADAASILKPGSVKAGSSDYKSITVSWSKVSGANGYSVYRATSKNGSYKLITETKSKSFKNTGLITGNTYYYKIKAYKISNKKKIYSVYSSIVSARVVPSTPSSLKTTSVSYNSITLSFSGVTGASGYSVYQAKSATGTYSLLTKTKSKSYKASGLTTGKTYYYKVRAYRTVGKGIVYGNYTPVVKSKTVLSAPTEVKTTSASSDSISLSWKKVSGASGYQIYGTESENQKFTLLSTTGTTSYTNTGLEAGVYYSYKIRAYKTVGSTKVYSSYSTVVGKKISETDDTSLSLNQTEKALTVGDTLTLVLDATAANETNTNVIWKSSDDTIVAVDKDGKVTAVGVGTAEITATTEDGNNVAVCTITVSDAVVTEKVEIKGIDVSKWQGTINWKSVKNAGIQFVMMRATYGSSSVDPTFERNYEGAKANGIAVGVYHYSYATTTKKALTEVKFLISKLQGKQLEYPVCIDIEDSSQSSLSKDVLNDIIFTYIDQLKEAGYYPMIYTNKNWFQSKIDDTKLSDIDHWLAEWGSSISYKGKVGIWQYSSTGIVNGISSKVDMDISFVDYASIIKSHHLNGF